MKFSIITASLNNAGTIGATIQSVISQTYSDIEYIIIDGGSTDGTVGIIGQAGTKISKVLSEPDTGIYDALNKGIGYATGEVIGFIHADDLYASEHVITHVAEAFVKTGADAVYGDLYYVFRNNTDTVVRYWKSRPFKHSLLKKGWMPPHPTLFVKRAMYEKHGVFDTSFRIAADYDLILRFFGTHRTSAIYLPEVLVRMRAGGISNHSVKNILLKMREDYKALRKNNTGSIFTLIGKNISKVSQFAGFLART